MDRPAIRCILVNYRSPLEMLRDCLESVAAAGPGVAVTIVDNDSADGVIEQLRPDFPDVQVVQMGHNAGFAAAVNRGLQECREEFVLMLNTDALLGAGALDAMLAALEGAGSDCAGVAPMMLSSAHEGVIDAIGTVMPPDGASFNRGIGQCDLGQFDRPEEVFGVCFGAALLRREAFEPALVGPLYEGYFLYFEDSDWCMRARSLGYRFLTAPKAIVYHLHSGITRHESLAFKYRLIELNTLKVVTRTFDSPLLVARIVASRCARLLARTFIRRRFVSENLGTIASCLQELPGLLKERKELKARRVVSDAKVFELARGEDAYFDTVDYRPARCAEALVATYERLARQKGEADRGGILAALEQWQAAADAGADADREALAARLRQLFAGEPKCARGLLKRALEERETDPVTA